MYYTPSGFLSFLQAFYFHVCWVSYVAIWYKLYFHNKLYGICNKLYERECMKFWKGRSLTFYLRLRNPAYKYINGVLSGPERHALKAILHQGH